MTQVPPVLDYQPATDCPRWRRFIKSAAIALSVLVCAVPACVAVYAWATHLAWVRNGDYQRNSFPMGQFAVQMTWIAAASLAGVIVAWCLAPWLARRLKSCRADANGPSMHLIAWRIVLAAVFGGAGTLVVLGYFLGDVDDHGWLFFSLGAVTGTSIAIVSRRRYLPRRLALSVAIVLFIVGGLIVLIAISCLFAQMNLLTGRPLDGLDVLLPFIWLIGSVIPLTGGVLLFLLAAPCRAWEHGEYSAAPTGRGQEGRGE